MRSLLALALFGIFVPPALAQYYLPAYRYTAPDALQNEVANWYRRFLNREPDPNGIAGWVGGLRQGNSPEKTLAGILGSDEYFAKSGNTPEGFIRTLYRDLLRREPTPGELGHWMRRVYHEDRSDLAYAFLMRYPQSWRSVPSVSPPPEERYEYRRPYWHSWHEEYDRRYRH